MSSWGKEREKVYLDKYPLYKNVNGNFVESDKPEFLNNRSRVQEKWKSLIDKTNLHSINIQNGNFITSNIKSNGILWKMH